MIWARDLLSILASLIGIPTTCSDPSISGTILCTRRSIRGLFMGLLTTSGYGLFIFLNLNMLLIILKFLGSYTNTKCYKKTDEQRQTHGNCKFLINFSRFSTPLIISTSGPSFVSSTITNILRQ